MMRVSKLLSAVLVSVVPMNKYSRVSPGRTWCGVVELGVEWTDNADG